MGRRRRCTGRDDTIRCDALWRVRLVVGALYNIAWAGVQKGVQLRYADWMFETTV